MFQDNLKVLRKKKGITQEELAARLNVVRPTGHQVCPPFFSRGEKNERSA